MSTSTNQMSEKSPLVRIDVHPKWRSGNGWPLRRNAFSPVRCSAGDLPITRNDEREEFAALQASLSAELRPQGAVEAVVFQELLHGAWNLTRFRRIEAEAFIGTLADFTDPATTAVLDRLGRYQARAQRAYYCAIRELRALQANRALQRPVPSANV